MELMIDTRDCRLDPRQTQHVLDHINLTWKLACCGMCGAKQFDLLALITLRFTDDPRTLVASDGPERPCAALICARCGNVMVIDLTVIGAWKVPGREANVTTGPYR